MRQAKINFVALVPGCGCAVNSILVCAMDTADCESIEYGLIFERFLNPERDSVPGVGIGFDERRGGEMLGHVKNSGRHSRPGRRPIGRARHP
ncbi:hypothetical protein ACIRJS_40370 [Streptomyces sp. NPDC102340]|uniref:hypothetical protein n=1 Tax=unclassified Streptomyces TaxID=2593676 RepID=UPI00381D042D